MTDSFVNMISNIRNNAPILQPDEMQAYSNIRDPRETCVKLTVFKHFLPVHYAIYFNCSAYFELFHGETSESQILDHDIQLPLNSSQQLTLRKGSDLLSLAIACNAVEICQTLLGYFRACGDIDVQKEQTPLTIAIVCHNDCTNLCLQHKDFMNTQMQIDLVKGESVFNDLFRFKRLEMLQFIYFVYLLPESERKFTLWERLFSQSRDGGTVRQSIERSSHEHFSQAYIDSLHEFLRDREEEALRMVFNNPSLSRLSEVLASYFFHNDSLVVSYTSTEQSLGDASIACQHTDQLSCIAELTL